MKKFTKKQKAKIYAAMYSIEENGLNFEVSERLSDDDEGPVYISQGISFISAIDKYFFADLKKKLLSNGSSENPSVIPSSYGIISVRYVSSPRMSGIYLSLFNDYALMV